MRPIAEGTLCANRLSVYFGKGWGNDDLMLWRHKAGTSPCAGERCEPSLRVLIREPENFPTQEITDSARMKWMEEHSHTWYRDSQVLQWMDAQGKQHDVHALTLSEALDKAMAATKEK